MPSASPPRASRVRRSELTCPGHSLKMMAKAAASAADEVILDLEDACAVSQKVEARATVVTALATLDFGPRVRAVRVNPVGSLFFYRDLVDVIGGAGDRLDVVVVPKIDEAEEVRFVDRLLGLLEADRGLPVGRIGLEVLLESAAGILHAEDIARSSPRLESLIFGVADYAGDLGARGLDEDPFALYHYPKARLLAAARAAGIDALDHVTIKFRDLPRCSAEAERAVRMGFDGKWAVHPEQVPVINAAFTPSPDEIARAAEILALYEKADTDEGRGAIVYKDEMIDAASLRVEAKKLRVARRAGLA